MARDEAFCTSISGSVSKWISGSSCVSVMGSVTEGRGRGEEGRERGGEKGGGGRARGRERGAVKEKGGREGKREREARKAKE